MVVRCWTILTLLVVTGCNASETSSATQKTAAPPAPDSEQRAPQTAKQPPETVKGKTLQQWVGQLGGGTVLERREAARALQEFDKYPGDEIIQRSNPVTGQSEPRRASAAFVEDLARALSDADSQVRRDVARTLGKLGPRAGAAEPALRKALKDEDEAVRERAAQALKQIDSAGDGKKGGR